MILPSRLELLVGFLILCVMLKIVNSRSKKWYDVHDANCINTAIFV